MSSENKKITLPDALDELYARIETIEGQRNSALTDHAIVSGKLAIARKRLAAAEEREGDLQAKVADLLRARAGQPDTPE